MGLRSRLPCVKTISHNPWATQSWHCQLGICPCHQGRKNPHCCWPTAATLYQFALLISCGDFFLVRQCIIRMIQWQTGSQQMRMQMPFIHKCPHLRQMSGYYSAASPQTQNKIRKISWHYKQTNLKTWITEENNRNGCLWMTNSVLVIRK